MKTYFVPQGISADIIATEYGFSRDDVDTQMGEVMPGFDNVALLKYPHLEKINHVHHAGNSSGIVDGAAALLIGSKEFGEKNDLKPRARIKATAKIGTDPTIMLTGPVPVTEKILADTGMSIKDIERGHRHGPPARRNRCDDHRNRP